MAELVTDVPDVVLAVYAHPDDADVASGGTLARWAAAGCEVHLVVLTDGGKGTADPATEPSELAARRVVELQQAAAVVGLASHQVLGGTDGELEEWTGLQGELVGWVRRIRPSVVFGHDPTAVFFGQDYFNHRDHRTAGWVLLDALAPASALPHYFPEQGPPHQVTTVYLSGTLDPDVWVDISTSIHAKAAAVECHGSQFAGEAGWVGDVVRHRAEEEGRRAGVPYAEGFRRLRLGG